MKHLLPLFFFLTGIDHQLWLKCSQKHKILEAISAGLRYYFLFLTVYLLFSFFKLNFILPIAIVLTFSFSLPLYLVYLSFTLFTYPKKYSGGHINALFLTRMFKFIFLALIFFIVSKGLDVYFVFNEKNTPTSVLELISAIFTLTNRFPVLKALTVLHMLLFFFPLVLPFSLSNLKDYVSLQIGMDRSIKDEEEGVAQKIIAAEYQSLYLKYKGKKQFQAHKNDGKNVNHTFIKREESLLNHSLFLYEWDKHK